MMNTEHNKILKQFETIKEHESFKVPDGYFESLPQQIQHRIRINSSKQKKSILVQLKPWISIAAILIIGLIFYKIGFQHDESVSNTLVALNETELIEPFLSELSETELMDYIANDENIEIKTQNIDLTMGLSPEDVENLVLF